MTNATIHPEAMNTTYTLKSLRRLLAALMLLLALGLMTVQTASAQVPQRLNYQSLVTDQGGDFLQDGHYNVTFRLYADQDAQGQALWTETQTVNVSEGLLSTHIGAEQPLDLPFDQPYFLTVQLQDQAESQPVALSTAAYALKARDVEDGTVVRSISGLQDDVEIVAGDGIALEQRDNQLVISAAGTPGLRGYGPDEAAIAASVKAISGAGLSEEEDEAAVEAMLSTQGPGGSNTGLDAAYDAGRVITLDAGRLSIDGASTNIGLDLRDARMLIRDGAGKNPQILFKTFGVSPVEVWRVGIDASTSALAFQNTTSGTRTPLQVTETATDNLATLNGSALELRAPDGLLKMTLSANYQGSGDSRLITDELEIKGGSDLAESFDITGGYDVAEPLPGIVVSIDPSSPGRLTVSGRAYDRMVAGVVSGAGGIETGLIMGQEGSVADGAYPVALTGRVYVWVDAAYGAVEPGDLLTTSETAGHAMRVSDHARSQGAILGKALTALPEGRGLVLMLVSLQ